jgi:hydroxyacylglutathione hydrolase
MYLVVDEASNDAAVVDPYDAKKISAAAKEKGVNVGDGAYARARTEG